ncbi:helix-turn-helix domain-containing protein [Streptomyces niveus]
MAVSMRLGEFLRARRARVRPEDVGLPGLPGRRRVAGLRREELSQLAGVSVSSYTRLEQGQSVHASDGALNSLATALRLDAHEHAHLRDLASRRQRPRTRPPAERVDPLTRELLRPGGTPRRWSSAGAPTYWPVTPGTRPARRAPRCRRARPSRGPAQPVPHGVPRPAHQRPVRGLGT